MADQAPLLKRQRVLNPASTAAGAAASDGAEAVAAAAAAAAEVGAQQTAAGPPPQQLEAAAQPASGSGSPKKPKLVVMPTPVYPPSAPADPAAWENAVLLVDKSKGWTSFDVCGKLRHALAALLGKKNREVKVGHAGGCWGLG
jgi:hypothetical protein